MRIQKVCEIDDANIKQISETTKLFKIFLQKFGKFRKTSYICTMTKLELIQALSKYDDSTPLYLFDEEENTSVLREEDLYEIKLSGGNIGIVFDNTVFEKHMDVDIQFLATCEFISLLISQIKELERGTPESLKRINSLRQLLNSIE